MALFGQNSMRPQRTPNAQICTNPHKSAQFARGTSAGRGFLWRLHSYRRFRERKGGVDAECPAISRRSSLGSDWLAREAGRSAWRRTLEYLVMPHKQLIAGLALLCAILPVASAAAERPAILLGAAWYPEQWPESRWPEDLKLMEAAHIHVVPHDASFRAPIRTHVAHADQHEVPVHGVANEMRGDENIARKPRLERRAQRLRVWNDKPESIAVHGQPSRDQILVGDGLRQRVTVRVALNQRSAGHQFPQELIKVAAFVASQPQLAHQLLESRSALRLPRNVLQDDRIRKHGEAVSYQHTSRAYLFRRLV